MSSMEFWIWVWADCAGVLLIVAASLAMCVVSIARFIANPALRHTLSSLAVSVLLLLPVGMVLQRCLGSQPLALSTLLTRRTDVPAEEILQRHPTVVSATRDDAVSVKPPDVKNRNSFALAGWNKTLGQPSDEPKKAAHHGSFLPLVCAMGLACWFVGTLYCLLRLVLDVRTTYRVIRCAAPCEDQRLLLAVARVSQRMGIGYQIDVKSSVHAGPFCAWLSRPTMVLPDSMLAAWSSESLECLLLHELAHFKRRDQRWVLLQRVADAVYWLLPPVRWLGRIQTESREDICDNVALKYYDALVYSEMLLKVAELVVGRRDLRLASAILAAGQSKALLNRIQSLLSPRRNLMTATSPGTRLALTLLASSMCLALSNVTFSPAAGAQTVNRTSNASPPSLDTTTSPPTSTTTTPSSNSVVEAPSLAQPARAGAHDQTIPSVISFRGRIKDSQDKTINGAQVVVTGTTPHLESLVTVSDGAGAFEIDVPAGTFGIGNKPAFIWAFKEGYSLRCVAPTIDDVRTAIEITLPPNETISVRVVDPQQKSAAGISVFPYWFNVPNGHFSADVPTGLLTQIPEPLLSNFQTRTDADGLATLSGVPRALLSRLGCEHVEYGTQVFRVEDCVQLDRPGSIDGQVICEDESLPEDLQVTITSRPGRDELYWPESAIASVKVQRDGRFRVPAIAAGDLSISCIWPTQSRLRPVVEPNLRVHAGAVTRVLIEAKAAVEIRGRVLVPNSKQPVPNARLVITSRMGAQRSASANPVTTNERGEFVDRTLPGKINIHLFEMHLKGYDYPGQMEATIPVGVPSFEMAPIFLKPAAIIRGRLAAIAGQSFGNRIIAIEDGVFKHLAAFGRIGADGKFEVMAMQSFLPTGDVATSLPHLRWVLLPPEIQDTENKGSIRKAFSDPTKIEPLEITSVYPLVLSKKSPP